MTSHGTTAFLRQAHRNNWEQYLASLKPGAQQDWDICVLTASDERQAEMYRSQLDWRREAGLLPYGMQTLVLPDPGGRRIGSGGATLNALAQVAGLVAECDEGRLETLQRILLIHSGGDSKRLPHCSATGKLFARVPRVLPDGRASTIFDEFLIGLSGLATQLPPGVLIASGDVLLVFDHLQLSGAFRRPGVIGVAAAVAAEMGRNHGVYVSGNGGHRVHAYLHKPPADELARWEAVDADGTVQIDTGLVWLDAPTAEKLVALKQNAAVTNTTLNLYGDLLMPLSGSTGFEQYLADTSDGPATPAVQAARRVIWERLRGTPFGVERLQPAVFVHFGSSREYWHMTAGDPELADLCGWTAQAAAWGDGGETAAGRLVLVNAAAEGPIRSHGLPVLVMDSRLDAVSTFDGAAIVAGVQTGAPLHVAPEAVLHQMPVAGGGFVTRVFGLGDDPKQRSDARGATFMHRTWIAVVGRGRRDTRTGVAARNAGPTDLVERPPVSYRGRSRGKPAPGAAAARPARRAGRLAGGVAGRAAPLAGRGRSPGRRPAAVGRTGGTGGHHRRPAFPRRGGGRRTGRGGKGAAWRDAQRHPAARPTGRRRYGRRQTPSYGIRGFKALGEATGSRAWEERAFGTLAELIERATLNVEGPRSRFQVVTFNLRTSNRQPILSARLRASTSAAAGPTRRPKASNAAAPCSMPR